MTNRTWLMSLSFVATLGVFPAVRPALAQSSRTDELLPPRFHVADSVAPRFIDLLALSPTFRGQCQRIADAGVVVVVEVVAPWDFNRGIAAKSAIVRDAGGIVRFVRVKLPMDGKFTVLLPHEMEHVLEQLEGVDLASLAKQRDSGTWRVARNVFETRRAQLAGHVVDREYRGGQLTADTFAARKPWPRGGVDIKSSVLQTDAPR